MFLPLYLADGRLQLEHCIQHWTPQYKKYIDLMKQIQPRTTKMIKGLGHMMYEEKLKDMVCSALKTEGKGKITFLNSRGRV